MAMYPACFVNGIYIVLKSISIHVFTFSCLQPTKNWSVLDNSTESIDGYTV